MNGYEFYRIKPGDQLYQIMRDHYGAAVFQSHKDRLIDEFKRLNKNIQDLDKIYPGKVIFLPTHGRAAPAVQVTSSTAARLCELGNQLERTDPLLLDYFKALKQFDPALNGIGGSYTGLQTFAQRAARDYAAKVNSITDTFADYKAQRISYAKYYKGRRLILDATDKKFHILRNGFQSPKPSTSILHMSAHQVTHSNNLDEILKPAKGMMSRAKVGGGILTLASVGVAGYRAYHAETVKERTVIVAETVAGAAGSYFGAIGGIALTGFLVSNPAGWTIIVGAAVGSALLSVGGTYLVSEAGERMFDSL